jgi:predicted DNA-binding transcriptional regulator AlpA
MDTIHHTLALPETGFLRLKQVLQLIPYKKTAWYAGLKAGRFPKPVPLGDRARGYRAEDIATLIKRLGSQPASLAQEPTEQLTTVAKGDVVNDTAPPVAEQKKRGRGRPKGSKNRKGAGVSNV